MELCKIIAKSEFSPQKNFGSFWTQVNTKEVSKTVVLVPQQEDWIKVASRKL